MAYYRNRSRQGNRSGRGSYPRRGELFAYVSSSTYRLAKDLWYRHRVPDDEDYVIIREVTLAHENRDKVSMDKIMRVRFLSTRY